MKLAGEIWRGVLSDFLSLAGHLARNIGKQCIQLIFLISFLDWIQKLSMGEDLAERVDDLICAWDNVVGTELETVVMLLLGRKEKKTHLYTYPPLT